MSIYVKTNSGCDQIDISDHRHLDADSNKLQYQNNGWTVIYCEMYDGIYYVVGHTSVTASSEVASRQLVIAGLPIVPIIDTYLPLLVEVGNTPVGYGRVLVSGNSGVYMNATSYGNSHSYIFQGYLICK